MMQNIYENIVPNIFQKLLEELLPPPVWFDRFLVGFAYGTGLLIVGQEKGNNKAI